jgi:hypothetical protein
MLKNHLTLSISAALVFCAASANAADWLQFGYDQVGSSNNSAEVGYSTAGNTFDWSVALGSKSDSTPILVSGVVLDAAHPAQTEDVLIIMSDNGIVRALRTSDQSEIWHAPASGGSKVNGAPAVSPTDKTYVYAYAQDGKIHKFRIADGVETIDAHWPEVVTIKQSVEKQASGLAIANTSHGDYLYSAMNGYGGDGGDYQGHVTTINLGDGSQYVFNMMCSQFHVHFKKDGTAQDLADGKDCDLDGAGVSHTDGQMSGIWGRPGVVYVADLDRIYFASGNGVFDVNRGAASNNQWGDTVLALSSNGKGQVLKPEFPLDSVTPKTFAGDYQWGADADLGSTSPAVLPSTSATFPHLAVQGGKEDCVRLLNLDKLNSINGGGAGQADTTVAPEMNPTTSCSADSVNGEIRTQPAVWVNPATGVTWFFIATDNGLYSYNLVVAGTNGSNVSITKKWTTMNGGTSPVIADGTLYYVTNHGSGKNTVHAVDPLTGIDIWSDNTHVGALHWQSPIVVNGHLYIADNASMLWSFTLDGIFKNGVD